MAPMPRPSASCFGKTFASGKSAAGAAIALGWLFSAGWVPDDDALAAAVAAADAAAVKNERRVSVMTRLRKTMKGSKARALGVELGQVLRTYARLPQPKSDLRTNFFSCGGTKGESGTDLGTRAES